MSVFGNGFLAYHIEVRVNDGYVQSAYAAVQQWKAEFRDQAAWPGFPDSIVTRIKALPGVTDVICEGPQSAVLIPLRMVKNLTGSPCTLSTTIGAGLITQAIEADLKSWDIELEPARRLEDTDAPLEFSFRDTRGESASLKLYPGSRRQFQAAVRAPHVLPKSLVLNRYNKGLLNLAVDVANGGGVVSFRPRELGRHDKIEDWISLLSHTRHLTVSSRHGVMKAFANYEGIQTARGWPETGTRIDDPVFLKLAEALCKRMPSGAIILLHRQSDGATLFFTQGQRVTAVSAPTGYGNESRMARLQGALLALTALRDLNDPGAMIAKAWQSLCADTVKIAWHGTRERPWHYPSLQELETTDS